VAVACEREPQRPALAKRLRRLSAIILPGIRKPYCPLMVRNYLALRHL
jgi:hypothetical protein